MTLDQRNYIYLGTEKITHVRDATNNNPSLHKIVTSSELKTLDTPQKIIDFLQKEDSETNKRNIDILISSIDDDNIDIYLLLKKIANIVGNDHWYSLLTTPNKENENVFGLWIKNGCNPIYCKLVFIDIFEKENLIKLLTQVEQIADPNNTDDTIPISFLISIDPDEILSFLEEQKAKGSLNDEQIRQVILSPIGTTNFFMQCTEKERLLDLFTDETIKNELDEYFKENQEGDLEEDIYLGDTLVAEIDDGIKNNPLLHRILTSNELKTLNTPQKIIDFLQKEDPETNRRNIDILISSLGTDTYLIFLFLGQIANTLEKDDWYSLLTTPNKENENAFGFWIKKGAKPSYYKEIFIDLFEKDNLVKLLTQVEQTPDPNNPRKTIPCNFLELNLVDATISFLQKKKAEDGLNDDQISQIILSPVGNTNFLIGCIKLDEQNRLRNLFSDEKMKSVIDDYIRKYQKRRKATQFLGIKDVGTSFNAATNVTTADTQKVRIGYEGMVEKENPLAAFKDKLMEFKPERYGEEFRQIKEAFSIAAEEDSVSDEQIKKYKSAYDMGKAIVIPSGWEDHSITIGAVKDYLVVANRGQGKHRSGGCIIYKLKNPPLTADQIKIFGEKDSIGVIRAHINNLVEPKIFQALPLKAQKYGTCTIANKKAVVAGMLPLLHYLNTGSTEQNISTDILNSTRDEYKKFTSSVNELTLKEILDEFNNPIKENINEVIEALCDFCNQHTDLKKESEVRLLQEISSNIPAEYKKEFFAGLSGPSKSIMSDLSEAHARFRKNY